MSIADLDDVYVYDIMKRWPQTIDIFLDLGLNCVGCPIGGFHTLDDAAAEHGLSAEALRLRIESALLTSSAAAPAPDRRR